jgi:hypothetical protein
VVVGTPTYCANDSGQYVRIYLDDESKVTNFMEQNMEKVVAVVVWIGLSVAIGWAISTHIKSR